MARTRVVTRTINAMEVTVKTVNPTTESFEDIKVTVSGELNEKAVKKAIANECATRGLVAIKVTDTKKIEQVFGMLETDFIKLARPMNELRQFIGDDEADEQK